MKKKLLLLCAVVGALLSIMAVTASATSYYDEDFSDPAVLDYTTKIGYSAAGTVGSLVEVVTEDADVTGDGVPDGIDGTIHLYNNSSSGTSLTFKVPSGFSANKGESVLMYDLVLPDTSSYNTAMIAAMMYYGGVRYNAYFQATRFYSDGGSVTTGHTVGQWYTYLYYLNADSSRIEVYRKLQSEPDSSFTLLGRCGTGAHTNGASFVWTSSANQKTDIYFDNVKLYTGTNLLSQGFDIDGTEIFEISEVAAGELAASIEVVTNKAQEGLNKLFVAYDKNGKLLACTVVEEGTENIILGHNSLSARMNLDAESAAAIADGGYVGLYIWDGMLPVMTPLELQ